jgi:LPXTG-motif cell wall-anchored protein
MPRTSLIAIAVACLLALPAVALAQSAPDTQYQDPLATPNSGSKSTPRSNGGGSGSNTPSQGTSSGSSGSGSSGTAGASASSGAAAGTTASGLPRTGGHPELLALAGIALLGGGFALRRAARV